MSLIKTSDDITKIKAACTIWKNVRSAILSFVKPGITTKELDEFAANEIKSYNAIPTFYHLYDFPGNICISVNNQLIHGVPNNYVIQPNDMITCDVGVTYLDHVCDAAFTFIVDPSNDSKKQHILNATYDALIRAIKEIKPSAYLGTIGATIEATANEYGYEVIKDYGGHGCGNAPHEDPIVLDYGTPNTGMQLQPNMVLCIEPMLMDGTDKYKVNPTNNWTVTAKNKKLTCHYEHMVLVTNTGCEVLTFCEDEKQQFAEILAKNNFLQ